MIERTDRLRRIEKDRIGRRRGIEKMERTYGVAGIAMIEIEG
jgi:hypothetical protein